mgnify:CR=1 FL=1
MATVTKTVKFEGVFFKQGDSVKDKDIAERMIEQGFAVAEKPKKAKK